MPPDTSRVPRPCSIRSQDTTVPNRWMSVRTGRLRTSNDLRIDPPAALARLWLDATVVQIEWSRLDLTKEYT